MSGTEYTVTITGPRGAVLVMTMDATLRHVTHLVMEDAVPHELLVISSVLAGRVEGTLELWRKEREKRAEDARCCGMEALGTAQAGKPMLLDSEEGAV